MIISDRAEETVAVAARPNPPRALLIFFFAAFFVFFRLRIKDSDREDLGQLSEAGSFSRAEWICS